MAKILIIEDELELARLIQVRLENAGFGVEIAGDGKEGLEKITDYQPDLVILDLILPQIDGYRVCELIKSDDKLRKIPVIMLTARAQDIEKKAGYAVGADEYIVKPYDPDQLLQKIKALLERKNKV